MAAANPTIRTPHSYQQKDINTIFERLRHAPAGYRLLYQLPTGGGKTLVFSEIAKRYIEKYGGRVTILTHRTELCSQTSSTLKTLGIANKVVNSATKSIRSKDCHCLVAMVETLRNRIRSGQIDVSGIGLVIIDEAHHNSFRKLLGSFPDAFVIGVTATPFSADIEKPMRNSYDSIVTGADIATLIAGGFLAKPEYFAYDVELNTLKTGSHGDYTVSSSNELYGSPAMLALLLKAYGQQANGKKTLIFNNGIDTSMRVQLYFSDAGYPIRHLDNRTPAAERKAILQWFRKTKGAILTSVSILTTGFDEPRVQAVILNRATTSITLYHQMVGRGSRSLPSKKKFRIIDLGNNAGRFGEWHEPVDWQYVFDHPEAYAEQLHYNATGGSEATAHAISPELHAKFPNTLEFAFDIIGAYNDAVANGRKPKTVLQESLRQQAFMCLENSETLSQALELAAALETEISWRVKAYVKCLDKPSSSYKKWLLEDYRQRLSILVKKLFAKVVAA